MPKTPLTKGLKLPLMLGATALGSPAVAEDSQEYGMWEVDCQKADHDAGAKACVAFNGLLRLETADSESGYGLYIDLVKDKDVTYGDRVAVKASGLSGIVFLKGCESGVCVYPWMLSLEDLAKLKDSEWLGVDIQTSADKGERYIVELEGMGDAVAAMGGR